MNDYACSTHAPSLSTSRLTDGLPYPSITRPRGVLTTTEFAYIQRREARQLMQATVEECRRRYLYSCRVTTVPEPSFATGPLLVDLTPLLYPWDRICKWYRDTVFNRQLDLFKCPYTVELLRWKSLVLERCLEPIFDDPQRVRLVLANVGIIQPKCSDYLVFDEVYEDDPERIFGWIIEDHDRRPWGT